MTDLRVAIQLHDASLHHGQASWNGVAILARGAQPLEVRRGLPGADDDSQSRYLEAAVLGIHVACLYLPNGNPQPGPRFDYKLAWFDRLIAHAATYAKRPEPVVLAGDFNVVPTNNNAIAEVTTAANVSVRLRRKLAHVSRRAYSMRANIIRTPRALDHARLHRGLAALHDDASH